MSLLILDFIISSGHPRFFLGSDSAPHPPHTKSTSTPAQSCAAGIYTSPILLPLVAELLDSFDALDKLPGFVSDFGRAFYGRPAKEGKAVQLKKVEGGRLVDEKYVQGDNELVPFWTGRRLNWEIVQS
jgi:dihydroorotase